MKRARGSALVAAIALCVGCADNGGDRAEALHAEDERAASTTPYKRAYHFTTDWFTGHIPHWNETLASFKGKPALHYLEVGVFEGRALFWVMEQILTHPTSRATGIDIMLGPNYLANVERSGLAERITSIRGPSQLELRKLPLEAYDIIYIDGSHTADDVLQDIVLSWSLLRPGGVLIMDDFKWDGTHHAEDRPLPPELVPRVAVDAFLSSFRGFIEVLHRDWQVVVRKRGDHPCRKAKLDCSVIGPYAYHWLSRKAYRTSDGRYLSLSDQERDTLEQVLRERLPGQTTLTLDHPLADDPAVHALLTRLRLQP